MAGKKQLPSFEEAMKEMFETRLDFAKARIQSLRAQGLRIDRWSMKGLDGKPAGKATVTHDIAVDVHDISLADVGRLAPDATEVQADPYGHGEPVVRIFFNAGQ